MKAHARFTLLALIVGALIAVSAPAAQGAVGIERFIAVNCQVGAEECGEEAGPATLFGPTKVPKEKVTKEEAEKEGYSQAGGHVPFGITDFKLNTVKTGKPLPATEAPTGILKHLRTDVAAGLATSPVAVPQCEGKQFGEEEALPGSGLYLEPTCPTVGPASTVIGKNEATVYAGETAGDVPLSGTVYNLVQKEGLASLFGVALALPKPITEAKLFEIFKGTNPGVEKAQYFGHTLIEGNVEWGQEAKGTGKGDYHDYFEVNVSTSLPLIRSRLTFKGRAGNGAFITNATSCPGDNTTRLSVEGTEGTPVEPKSFTTPIGLSGCNLVPFQPSFSLTPATAAHDQPDGVTAQVGLKRFTEEEIDSAQLKTAVVTLPEGMTLNPSAAAGLGACTPAQARIHSSVAGVACPASSEIGTVAIEVPTLPPGSLSGKIYLGGPESGPITGPPYVMYLDAESARYGVSVRLKGEAVPNEATGQVTTIFSENPEQPFTTATLHFKEGALAPIANPLTCGTATAQGVFTPFTLTSARTLNSAFAIDNDGKGGACASPPPLSLAQSAANQNGNAGGHTSDTFTLTRADGNQYVSEVSTTLPAGLVGAIPIVTQCAEAQANAGSCPASSQIGEASVLAGSGPTPFSFKGPVYLTGPYKGAPFGMSIAVPAVAGPFNLGTVVTRATISVNPYTARVTVAATLPRIVKGVPIRLRSVTVSVNKQGFLFNPTNCSPMAYESVVNGFTTVGGGVTGTVNLSSPFQVGECGKLAFKPSFKAASGAKTSKANGASIETTIDQPAGQANIKSVKVQLPLQLPSRLTTLQKACPAAIFEADPFKCPSGSFVGGVRANTPTLPAKMKGPAILVSHAAAAFPDLDLVLEGNGVRVIVVGNTDIKKGITMTTFASTPDVPVSSVTVNLPIGPHSALAAFGNLCARSLVMPTTLVSQSGKTIKQNTKIKVKGCGVRIVGHKVVGRNAFLTVQTFSAGRVSGKGGSLRTVFRSLRGAVSATRLKVSLSRGGQRRHRPFKTRVRVGFVPRNKHESASAAFVTVTFR